MPTRVADGWCAGDPRRDRQACSPPSTTRTRGDTVSTSATCVHCGTRLRLRPCGCYVDWDGTRWCPGGKQRHEPEFGTQPETCAGEPS